MDRERHITNTSNETPLLMGCNAMATRFEIALWGASESYLRGAAQEALDEIEAIEGRLSIFLPTSDLYEVNARAHMHPVCIDRRVYELLRRAKSLWEETEGVFDPTIAPLLGAWGFIGGAGAMASEEEILAAKEKCGMDKVLLDDSEHTVMFSQPGMMMDLGAIGKGYGIECAAEILRELRVPNALIHGGTSSIYAIGVQPDGDPWRVAIQDPIDSDKLVGVIGLTNASLSVSAGHGKSFQTEEGSFGHVLDPRSGRPVKGALLSAVVCPSATDGDALSTALLVRGEEFFDALLMREETGGMVVLKLEGGEMRRRTEGMDLIPC